MTADREGEAHAELWELKRKGAKFAKTRVFFFAFLGALCDFAFPNSAIEIRSNYRKP